MTSSDSTVLCRYRYDPLDRLASSSLAGQADVQRFYQKNRLATEIQGTVRRTVFQHEDLLLAQQRRTEAQLDTTLWATDQQRSVLQLVDKTGTEPMAYSVYGHHPAESGLTSLLGFNGERCDPATGHYLLGNGYRAYNPVLMRFNSPDNLSPFDEGGLNAYGYVGGDPVGFVDPSGHIPIRRRLKINFGRRAVDSVSGKFERVVTPSTSNVGRSSSPNAGFYGSSALAALPGEESPILRSLLEKREGATSSTIGSSASQSAVGMPVVASSSTAVITAPVNSMVSSASSLLSPADFRRYYSLLSVGIGNDLPLTKHLSMKKIDLLNNRVSAGEKMIAHYRALLKSSDAFYHSKYKRSLAKFKSRRDYEIRSSADVQLAMVKKGWDK
ncbi:RHS repeat-associated core domain-containing protein [Pseudomonas syringae]|uniref:RHS repeat-associated core domain-containing protein n=1 Tax=Pseudomonas syringae TaxID=317 RepID=UPI001CA88AA0|nr:RHS repeat-associated core domain-containing protein [Pseudomonas syringae]MCI3947825.1 RHS repeat-associated core domain-containing protein [Pseudomonas syringae]